MVHKRKADMTLSEAWKLAEKGGTGLKIPETKKGKIAITKKIQTAIKLAREAEKEAEERLIGGLEEFTMSDAKRQKARIQTKLAEGKKLTSFEKWLMTKPYYEAL